MRSLPENYLCPEVRLLDHDPDPRNYRVRPDYLIVPRNHHVLDGSERRRGQLYSCCHRKHPPWAGGARQQYSLH